MLIRSILFYILLSFWTVLLGLLCTPFLLLPKQYLYAPIRLWIDGIFLLLKKICKITHQIQGLKNIPQHSVLVASKHQSAFETFALFYYLPKSVFIHKKQLFLIPIFGQYLKKINMISIDRKAGSAAMRKILRQAKLVSKKGYSLIIFPEGTRKKPGEKPDYKSGFIGIYNEMNTKILPVAVNSGKFWPKHTFVKKPGIIKIKFLNLIPANLDRSQVLKKVQEDIENGTNSIS